MGILKMVQGSIPVVIGSLTKTELKKSGEKTMGIKDINYVMYHDTTGVRTAAKAALGNKNSVLSNINRSERNSWVKTEIGWMYNENGKPVTGWKLIDGKWYYLYEDGHMAKSEKIQGKDGKVYDIDENGVCVLSSSRSIDEKIDNFMEGTAEIGNWYTKNITTYLGGEIVNGGRTRRVKKCELINNIDVGDDCSGFVWHKKDDKYIPKRGDILVQHEHYVKEAQVWSWGKVYKSLPAPRTKSGLYGRTSGYWRIEK